MGFRNSEWAWGIELPGPEKAILVAIAHRADDKTGVTYVGRKSLASMSGYADRTVTRALETLESRGAIKRKERRRTDGYRTTDEITIDVTWTGPQVSESQVTESHVTDSQVTVTTTSSDSHDDLRGQSVQASSKELEIHEVTGDTHTFDDFWSAWPRKVKKPIALKAWQKAIKRADPEQIIDAAIAYRDNPGRPDVRYIPHPSTWLNADSWNDELEDSRARGGRPTPMERAQATLQAGQNIIQARQVYGNVTTLNPKGITA